MVVRCGPVARHGASDFMKLAVRLCLHFRGLMCCEAHRAPRKSESCAAVITTPRPTPRPSGGALTAEPLGSLSRWPMDGLLDSRIFGIAFPFVVAPHPWPCMGVPIARSPRYRQI